MNQYIGQLMLASWSGWAPRGWAQCNGQLLPINSNQALFSLLGTFYGGDGIQSFALPDLRGRAPLGFGLLQGGSMYAIGQKGGEEQHTVLASEVPSHTHTLMAYTAADSGIPGNNVLSGGGISAFAAPTSLAAMSSGTIGNSGGSQAHENRQPYVVMNWCISLTGVYPSRS